VALVFAVQNVAWAVCADGTTFPAGGYKVGTAPVTTANNFDAQGFTGTNGSIFVPDNSVNENNDPSQPLTGGGHNWAFDQGATLCKVTDVGPGGQPATGWQLPFLVANRCVIMPIVNNGVFTSIGGVPREGDVITPTCNPAALSTATAPNPNNTYFNQLGCAIEASRHGLDPATGLPRATTPHTADSYLGVADIRGSVFSYQLSNVVDPVLGGDAGKVVGASNWFSNTQRDSNLNTVTWSPDGHFLLATSTQRDQAVWACLDPLGYPGDPSQPLNPNFVVPTGKSVPCMVIGNNNLPVDETTKFGPDNQPYFGGQTSVNTFNATPGGKNASAWPQCIYQNDGGVPFPPSLFPNPTLSQQEANFVSEFQRNSQGHCGNAQPNSAFAAALVTQSNEITTHGQYMYAGPIGGSGTVVQFKVTQNPVSGQSQYAFRQYASGLLLPLGGFLDGVGVADDLGSLMTMTDPSTIGLGGVEVITRLPLCEDM
jgi:hypothetical protein